MLKDNKNYIIEQCERNESSHDGWSNLATQQLRAAGVAELLDTHVMAGWLAQ